MTPAPARSHRRTDARSTVAPRGPRRVSGPVNRRMVAAPAAGAALPRRGNTGLFARVRALPEHRVVDRLLRSRAWIWALGALLGGIVAMQVSLLKLNSGISRAVETTTTLERQNAQLEAKIATLNSTNRIEKGAGSIGMVQPEAGAVRYVTPGADDASKAVDVMRPPSQDAVALLANHGIVPGSLAAEAVPPDTTAAGTTTTPETPVTPEPVAPEPAATVPAPTPAEPTTTTYETPPPGAAGPQG